MSDLTAELAASPALYPQKIDPGGTILFVRMDAAAYRAASFLDDRVLAPGMQAVKLPFAAAAQAMRAETCARPLHFIFHTGHVGSTLLSRLIDESGATLGLREPLPLRALAEMQDRPNGTNGAQLDAWLQTFFALWRRGFANTQAVVLKATSSTARLAPRLLRESPASKAVYLNLRAEPYLATLLGGAHALNDLKGFEIERGTRLRKLLGILAPLPASVGELAAMSWLAESLTQADALARFEGRVLPLDFEMLLADVGPAVARVLAHFDIAAPPGFDAALSPVLTRYSKAPQQFAYSSALRAQVLAQARREHAAEIARGMRYLEHLGTKDARVAAVL